MRFQNNEKITNLYYKISMNPKNETEKTVKNEISHQEKIEVISMCIQYNLNMQDQFKFWVRSIIHYKPYPKLDTTNPQNTSKSSSNLSELPSTSVISLYTSIDYFWPTSTDLAILETELLHRATLSYIFKKSSIPTSTSPFDLPPTAVCSFLLASRKHLSSPSHPDLSALTANYMYKLTKMIHHLTLPHLIAMITGDSGYLNKVSFVDTSSCTGYGVSLALWLVGQNRKNLKFFN